MMRARWCAIFKALLLMMTRGTATDAIGAVATRKTWIVKEFSAQGNALFGHGIVVWDVVFRREIRRLQQLVWCLLVVGFLWFASTCYNCQKPNQHRKKNLQFTHHLINKQLNKSKIQRS